MIGRTTLLLLTTAGVLLSQTAVPPDGMNAFGKMVPTDFVNRGVIIPSFNAEGRKSSELRAETLTRIDDDRLQAGKVNIEIYAADPAQNIQVQLISAVHHMTDQVLRSGERSVVRRSDFETSGDSLVFDSRTSIGSMKGRVRTLIFDTSALSGKTDK
ncbi:MAG: hypothetical protein ABL974_01075 [Prosthecobacter sp.]